MHPARLAAPLAFTNRESRSHIWLLPFDLNRGKPAGASERITDGPAGSRIPIPGEECTSDSLLFQPVGPNQHLEAGSGHRD